MSFAGHVDCQRIEIGPVCPLAIIGKPSVAAPAAAPVAAVRNLRRVGALSAGTAAAGNCGLRDMCPPECARPWTARDRIVGMRSWLALQGQWLRCCAHYPIWGTVKAHCAARHSCGDRTAIRTLF